MSVVERLGNRLQICLMRVRVSPLTPFTRRRMYVHEIGTGIHVLDLEPEKHFRIKTNKHGRTKFKLRSRFKRLMKRLGISYYLLPGNDFPTQIVLRNIDDKKITYLSLL